MQSVRFAVWGLLLLAGCAATPVAPPVAPVAPPQAGWSDWTLPGKRSTRYTQAMEDGRPVIHAESHSSASLLRRMVRLEPGQGGTLNFSWRVTDLIATADLSDRDAEDSPARVVLAFEGDRSRLSTRDRMLFELAQAVTGEAPPYATLMYVWDTTAPPGSVIHSGRSDRIRKIVVESGAAHRGVWRHYERQVADDYRRAFGEEPGPLVGVALMTDSDNTRSSARASYGEVRLTTADGRQL